MSRSEQVETDLDRLIEKRHDQRVQSEGERLEANRSRFVLTDTGCLERVEEPQEDSQE